MIPRPMNILAPIQLPACTDFLHLVRNVRNVRNVSNPVGSLPGHILLSTAKLSFLLTASNLCLRVTLSCTQFAMSGHTV